MVHNEMPEHMVWDPQARYLQIEERVTNVRTSLTALENKVERGFGEVHNHISANVQALTAQLTSLSSELRSGQKTQWPVILTVLGLIATVMLGFGGALGYAVLSPLKETVAGNSSGINELTRAMTGLITNLPESFIPRRETERLSLRSAEDRARVEENVRAMMPRAEVELLREASAADRKHLWDELAKVRDSTVQRNEWMERNRARDTEMAEINRRVDEIRQELGSQYGVRDVIMDLKAEINSLRAKMEAGLPPRLP